MTPKFSIGDVVDIDILGLTGKIVSIDEATEKLKKLTETKEDFLLYKVEIDSGIFVTTTEDSLEKITAGRAKEDNERQNECI
jgi:hypothetical protein